MLMKRASLFLSLITTTLLVSCGGGSKPAPTPTISYSFHFVGEHCNLAGKTTYDETIKEGESRTFTITTDKNHLLTKENVNVRGEANFDESKQQLIITSMKSDVVVTANAKASCHLVILVTDGLIDGKKNISENVLIGSDHSYQLTPNDHFAITKKSINVNEGSKAEVNLDTDKNILHVNKIANDTSISVKAKHIYQFTFNGTNCHIGEDNNYQSNIIEGEKYNYKVTCDLNFVVTKEQITIVGKAFYDIYTRSIVIDEVDGNIEINATAVEGYVFNFLGEHCAIDGKTRCEIDVPKVKDLIQLFLTRVIF